MLIDMFHSFMLLLVLFVSIILLFITFNVCNVG